MFGPSRSVLKSTGPYFSYNFEDDFVDPFEVIYESPLMDQRLVTFGNNLKASDEYRKQAKNLTRKVFDKLRMHSKLFRVVDTIHGGSFGKRTDVLDPDLDLVVIVGNIYEPPYESPLDDFEQILRTFEDELRIVHGSIQRKSLFSVQFKFENGMEVDLLPAMNIKSSEVHELLQYQPERFYEYGTALCRRQLTFMKSFEKDDFVMCVIRLAKLWLKSLNFGEKYLTGGSTIMELLSIASVELDLAKVHFNLKGRSISRCLTRVWNMIIKLETVKLVFEEVSKNVWRLIPMSHVSQYQWGAQTFVASAEILNRDCFIVEPANPFNDMLAGQDADVLKKLKQFAQVSKSRLDELLINFGSLFENIRIKVDIHKLFEHQPLNLRTQFPNGIPDKVIVSWDFVVPVPEVNCTRNPTCQIKIRNQGLMKKEAIHVRYVLDILRQNLLSVINCIIIGNPDLITDSEVEDQVTKFIKDRLATQVITPTSIMKQMQV